jgi:hypothetical protein
MEVLEVLSENIEFKDTLAINKLVDHYLTIEKSKKVKATRTAIEYFINFYTLKYINKNVWVLKELSTYIKKYEEAQIKEDELLKGIALLLATNNMKEIKLNYKKDTDAERIRNIIHCSQIEYAVLYDLKNILYDDIYVLINSLYRIMLISNGNAFLIIRWLISMNKKNLFRTEQNDLTDGYDIIYLVILRFVNTVSLPDDVNEFALLSKDLFYYRCKQKLKKQRANLLFYSVYVIMQRNVINQYLDMPKDQLVSAKKTDYLFVWMNIDEVLCKNVMLECELKKKYVHLEKVVFIEDTIMKTYERVVDVVKKNNNII